MQIARAQPIGVTPGSTAYGAGKATYQDGLVFNNLAAFRLEFDLFSSRTQVEMKKKASGKGRKKSDITQ
ncbi:MAG: hypothetical protein IJ524_00675 [Bacteroidales bacterium]|nr:hypothetical protein [Bacteroidales bacterium]